MVQLVLGDGQGRQAVAAVVPMVVSPYGFWSSPITSDLVVADAIRLDQVALDGNAIYWTEFSRRSRADPSCTAPLKVKRPSL